MPGKKYTIERTFGLRVARSEFQLKSNYVNFFALLSFLTDVLHQITP